MPPDPAPLAGIAPFHPSNGSECMPKHDLATKSAWRIEELLTCYSEVRLLITLGHLLELSQRLNVQIPRYLVSE
jgi:hypothetical protein